MKTPSASARRTNLTCLIVAAFWLMSAVTGCEEGSTEPESSVDTILLVEEGSRPVWMPDGDRFLFTFKEELDSSGIFIASMADNTPVKIWNGAHNHDFVPSPDGTRIALSSPDQDDGVYVVGSDGDDPQLVLPGGRRPSWRLDSEAVFAEDAQQQVVSVNITSLETEVVVDEGYYPKGSPVGPQVAYLHTIDNRSGFNLRIIDTTPGALQTDLSSLAGPDFVWDPDGQTIYVTQLTDGTLSNILTIDLQNPDEFETLIERATRPSIGNGGAYMLVARINADWAYGIDLYDFNSGDLVHLLDVGTFPAASPDRNEALVETDLGIYHLSW